MITFINESKKNVVITDLVHEPVALKAGEKKSVSLSQGNEGLVWLKHEKDSYASALVAHMNVAVKYDVSQLEEDAEVVITREKISVDHFGFYDRFFIECENGEAKEQGYEVQGREALINLFRRKWFVAKFLLAPLASTELFLTFGIASLIIMANTDTWKYWMLYAVSVYLLSFFLQELGEKFSEHIRRKKEKADMRGMIEKCSEDEFIRSYYAQENRKPVWGKVEH